MKRPDESRSDGEPERSRRETAVPSANPISMQTPHASMVIVFIVSTVSHRLPAPAITIAFHVRNLQEARRDRIGRRGRRRCTSTPRAAWRKTIRRLLRRCDGRVHHERRRPHPQLTRMRAPTGTGSTTPSRRTPLYRPREVLGASYGRLPLYRESGLLNNVCVDPVGLDLRRVFELFVNAPPSGASTLRVGLNQTINGIGLIMESITNG